MSVTRGGHRSSTYKLVRPCKAVCESVPKATVKLEAATEAVCQCVQRCLVEGVYASEVLKLK